MNRRQLFQSIGVAAAMVALGAKAEPAQAAPHVSTEDWSRGTVEAYDWAPGVYTRSPGYTPADDSNIVYISEAQIEAMLKSPPRWDRTPASEYAREQAEDGWDTYLLGDA